MVRAAITPKTKLIILNSPSNPSGRVIPPAEFERIMEVVSEHGIYVISDECYLRFVYAPARVFRNVFHEPLEFRRRNNARIMEVVSEHGIYVISDECYLRFVYAPARVF